MGTCETLSCIMLLSTIHNNSCDTVTYFLSAPAGLKWFSATFQTFWLARPEALI